MLLPPSGHGQCRQAGARTRNRPRCSAGRCPSSSQEGGEQSGKSHSITLGAGYSIKYADSEAFTFAVPENSHNGTTYEVDLLTVFLVEDVAAGYELLMVYSTKHMKFVTSQVITSSALNQSTTTSFKLDSYFNGVDNVLKVLLSFSG